MSNSAYVVWLAILGQAGQAEKAHQAKQEQDGAEDDEHVVSDAIDNELEAVSVLIVAHEGTREHEADDCRIDGVTRIDEAHADLGLVACVEDLGVRCQLYLLLDLQQLVEDERVSEHDEQASESNHFQREVFKTETHCKSIY